MKAGHAKAWLAFLKISYDDSDDITGKIMQIIFFANGCFKADYYQDAIVYEHQNKNYDQENIWQEMFRSNH